MIDSSGYIVTNSHVIEGAEAAAIWTEDGEFFNRVVVVADDPERDLALLRVPTEELPALCVGTDAGVELGVQRVRAVLSATLSAQPLPR